MKKSIRQGAIRINADGFTSMFFPERGKTLKLEEAQKIVGGPVEIVYLTDKCIMIVNEEGKNIGLSYNERATIIAKAARGIGIGDYIVGDVIMCPSKMFP